MYKFLNEPVYGADWKKALAWLNISFIREFIAWRFSIEKPISREIFPNICDETSLIDASVWRIPSFPPCSQYPNVYDAFGSLDLWISQT